ncbi:chaperone modulator CbpM [Ruegeria profundi]|uniref:chaperone modulator CbpM n=1 Tax=Ruegeria profundi TaxID=1685378 RepID=UPI001CD3417A|nr:chaperone modulator CbpM [Ruegeria profundi]MCA0929375.1 chaperone modulator CbpM [Ruegeria profundi]
MTRTLTEEQLIATVTHLTSTRLTEYLAAEIVIPEQTEKGPVYRTLDAARLELACELHDQYEMEPDALSMMISLIDQMHGLRAELREVLNAIEAQPEPVRQALIKVIGTARFGGE